jgi:hypothetical protein
MKLSNAKESMIFVMELGILEIVQKGALTTVDAEWRENEWFMFSVKY